MTSTSYLRSTVILMVAAVSLSCSEQVEPEATASKSPLPRCPVEISVLKRSGETAKERGVQVLHLEGEQPEIVLDGFTGDDGILRGDVPCSSESRFAVRTIDAPLGAFRLSEEIREYRGSFTLPPRYGDEIPDFEFTDVRSGEARSPRDFRGHVVVLDFWATWCQPCLPSMDKLSALSEGREDWRGDVLTIAVSVENACEAVGHFYEQRGWQGYDEVWCSAEETRTLFHHYGLGGLPTIAVVDAEGVIRQWRSGTEVFRGVERTVDDLLEGG